MKFVNCTSIQYNKLEKKDQESLYFISDTHKLFKGIQPLNNDIIVLKTLPSVGEYDNLYLVNNKLYIWHKYITHENKEHPDIETIKENWLCLNECDTKLNDDNTTETTVLGDAAKKYIDYKFEHAPIFVDAENVKYDNTKIDNKSMKSMQDVIDFAFKNL